MGVKMRVLIGVKFGVFFGVTLGDLIGVWFGVALGDLIGVIFGVCFGVSLGDLIGVSLGDLNTHTDYNKCQHQQLLKRICNSVRMGRNKYKSLFKEHEDLFEDWCEIKHKQVRVYTLKSRDQIPYFYEIIENKS